MGTRGVWGFYKNGKTYATYNHYDSYPTGLGETIKNFVLRNPKEKIENLVNELYLVEEDGVPSTKEVELLQKYNNENVNEGKLQWYNLLRETQGNPQAYIDDENLRAFINSEEFLKNSLFCEWAYIINLDEEVLEIYRGFVTNPPQNSRYYDDSNPHTTNGYYPVEMVEKVSFNELKNFSMEKFENNVE
ncbi:MAG: hypothetical protein ACOC1O_00255 [bacterium]